jgi:SAM-dependent methyltransferase
MNIARSPEPLSALTAAATLRQMIMGFRVTQLVYVAAKLGLADHLRPGPQSPQELAQAAGAEPQALRRLLRALASLGLFTELDDGAFALTPLAELLQSDTADSLRSLALLYGEEWLWHAYGRMLYSVQTGQPAFEQAHGQPLYDYLHDHPPAAALFHQAMSGYSAQEAAAILAAYDFSEATTVVDVGGGHGVLVAALLQALPHLSGVVFDLALVVADARRLLADAGVAARSRYVAGDFFAAVPGGGDVYLLKSVLHNWDDAAAVRILRRCRQAMAEHARLLVVERVIPPGNTPAEAKLFDINMLVVVGGQERTEAEYRALFLAAGFNLTQIVPTHSHLSLIEGTPAAAKVVNGIAATRDGDLQV